MRMASWMCVVVALAGCGPDLGECNEPVARSLVYTPDGTPYFEGQALVHQSCASSFCHAEGAKNDARKGAPHGLDFDVAVLTTGSSVDQARTLRSGILEVRREAVDIYDQVESGAMPPGDEGEAAQANISWRREAGGALVDAALPKVGTSAGQEILRNWLACNAPLVAARQDATAEVVAAASAFGEVIAPAASTVSATFESIYADVLMGGTCRACHVAGGPYSGVQAIDLTTLDTAYASLVDVDAFAAGECGGRGKLVVPGDCEGSLLYQKLLPEGEAQNLCGAPMPITGQPLPSATLAAICQWIDAGAVK